MKQFLLVVVLVTACSPLRASPLTGAEAAFHLLYETHFAQARSQFLELEKTTPQDPLNHDWVAASYLFEEFYRDGVLTSQFFLDNNRFLGGVPGKPDDRYKAAFFKAANEARQLSERRLAANPTDREALFALTLAMGMQADYASLIERRQIASLEFIRQSEDYARRLLAADPDSADAYVALGSANYIIGSLPAHKRFFLWLGGIKGDKQLGIEQLTIAAARGDYLRPFAKILLALVDLREGKVGMARSLFADLAQEFPENPLFAHELALASRPRPEARVSARTVR